MFTIKVNSDGKFYGEFETPEDAKRKLVEKGWIEINKKPNSNWNEWTFLLVSLKKIAYINLIRKQKITSIDLISSSKLEPRTT